MKDASLKITYGYPTCSVGAEGRALGCVPEISQVAQTEIASTRETKYIANYRNA